MGRPLGFNNTYALGMKAGRAAMSSGSRRSPTSLRHPGLSFGFSNEFIDRDRRLAEAPGCLSPAAESGSGGSTTTSPIGP